MRNTVNFQKIKKQLLLIFFILVVSLNAQAQQLKNKMLTVYKIDFGFYLEASDTNHISEVPMHVEQEKKTKNDWKPLLVYANPEYLYAEQRSIGNEKTTWQLHYKSKSLMELRNIFALPTNFDDFLFDNVYNSDEPIADSDYGHGIITLTDDTKTVAGYICKRAVINYSQNAIPPGDTKLEITVWYCPKLPKFYLPEFEYLQKIPGAALLIWQDRGHNEHSGLIAKSVLKQQKPLSFFKLPKGKSIMYPPKLK